MFLRHGATNCFVAFIGEMDRIGQFHFHPQLGIELTSHMPVRVGR